MRLPGKIAALFDAMTLDDLETMPPAERRRFADLCRHWADRADRPRPAPARAGVLARLQDGDRAL